MNRKPKPSRVPSDAAFVEIHTGRRWTVKTSGSKETVLASQGETRKLGTVQLLALLGYEVPLRPNPDYRVANEPGIAMRVAEALDKAARQADRREGGYGYEEQEAEVYRSIAAQIRHADAGPNTRRVALGIAVEAEETADRVDERPDPHGYEHEEAEAYREAARIIRAAVGGGD